MHSSTRRILFIVAGLVLALLLGTGTLTAAAQGVSENESEPIEGIHIRVERDGANLTILPTYALPDTAAGDTVALRYELTVERTGASTSRTRQGGTFTPTPGDVDTLSTVHLNAQPGDRLHLHLVVRRKGEAIAEATRTEKVPPPE